MVLTAVYLAVYDARMEVQQALREAMKESGWPLERIAFECGVSASGAQKWLKGSPPGGNTLLALMRKLPGFARRLGFSEVQRAA